MQAEDIIELQKLVPRVPVSDHVAHFAVDLVQSTRPGNGATASFIKEWVNWGAVPLRYFPKGHVKKEYAVLPKRMMEDRDRLKKLVDQSIRYVSHPPST